MLRTKGMELLIQYWRSQKLRYSYFLSSFWMLIYRQSFIWGYLIPYSFQFGKHEMCHSPSHPNKISVCWSQGSFLWIVCIVLGIHYCIVITHYNNAQKITETLLTISGEYFLRRDTNGSIKNCWLHYNVAHWVTWPRSQAYKNVFMLTKTVTQFLI